MLKLVLDDYLHGFQTAWKRGIKTGWFLYFYMLVWMPMMYSLESTKYLVGAVSMIIGIMLARMYPNQMNKILFLCPLTEQDRKKYLETAYWLRISIPMVICLSTGAISLVMGYFSLFYYVAVCLHLFFFLVGVNVYCMPDKELVYSLQRIYKLPGMYEIWNILTQIVGIFGITIFASMEMDAGGVTDKIIISAFVFTEMLLCIRMRVIYYGPVMARGMQYESSRVNETGK